MINLEIRIGSRPYQITCREGQEPHYEALTKIINEKIATAESALGSMSETRLLMYATLLLADEINDIRAGGGAPVAASSVDPAALERVADRMEALATALEASA
jgi:cell division protein ZapA